MFFTTQSIIKARFGEKKKKKLLQVPRRIRGRGHLELDIRPQTVLGKNSVLRIFYHCISENCALFLGWSHQNSFRS